MKVLGLCGDYTAVSAYRIVRPLLHAGQEVITPESREKLIIGEIGAKFSQYDAVVIKYIANAPLVAELLAAKHQAGVPLYVDMDDDVFHIPKGNIAETFWGKPEKIIMKFLLQNCDGIICSTQYLADKMKKYNPNVIVVSNKIQPEEWKALERPTDKTVIGWTFSPTHIPDAPIIRNVIKKIKEKYGDKVIFEVVHGKFQGANAVKGTSFRLFPELMSNMRWDISLAPLKDNEFNRCKSNIKWMEASMSGCIFVGSDVEPYSEIVHGETGYKCKTEKQWVDTLSWIIENKDIARQTVKKAQDLILSKYTVSQNDILEKIQTLNSALLAE